MTTQTTTTPAVPDWIDLDRVVTQEMRERAQDLYEVIEKLVPTVARVTADVEQLVRQAWDNMAGAPDDLPTQLIDATPVGDVDALSHLLAVVAAREAGMATEQYEDRLRSRFAALLPRSANGEPAGFLT